MPAETPAPATPPALGGVEPRPGVPKTDPILVVDGVRKRFGGLVAVDVEHLEVPRGTITALIGPNGAGKTTLFNVLTGFDRPQQGRWSFDGRPLQGRGAYRVARAGMVRTFQLTKALSKMSVLDNMMLAATGQAGRAHGHRGDALALAQPGGRRAPPGRGPARALRAGADARRVRGHPLGRPAQAAGDGQGAHGGAPADHARRAHGRREPGPHPVPPRPRAGPARRRHVGAVRGARHGRGDGHQRLGGVHGLGLGDLRGAPAGGG